MTLKWWTEDEEQILKLMWMSGKTMGAIMVALQGRSRNSIIGKADRLNLPPFEQMAAQRPPAGKLPLSELDTIPLKKRQRLVLDALLRSYPAPITMLRLADHVYADDPNGGPDDLKKGLRSCMASLERALSQAGWKIDGCRHGLKLAPANPAVANATISVDPRSAAAV